MWCGAVAAYATLTVSKADKVTVQVIAVCVFVLKILLLIAVQYPLAVSERACHALAMEIAIFTRSCVRLEPNHELRERGNVCI